MKRYMPILFVIGLLAIASAALAQTSIGVIASTGDDEIQLTASYPLYEWDWAELYGDVMYALESKRVGAGLSVCSDRTGWTQLDNLLDALHVDGVGIGGYTTPEKELEWFGYVKFGVYQF